MSDARFLDKIQINNGSIVLLLDDSMMKATHVGTLNMPSLQTKTTTTAKSLLSLSATCDDGNEERFMRKEVHDTCKGVII